VSQIELPIGVGSGQEDAIILVDAEDLLILLRLCILFGSWANLDTVDIENTDVLVLLRQPELIPTFWR
jgi:hypothetical protein